MTVPGEPAERIREGFRQLAEGRFDRAAGQAEAGLREHPDDPYAWHLLGLARLKAGRTAEALECLEGAVRRLPGSAGSWLDLGNARLAAGDRAGAGDAFREAARLRPQWAAAHHNLGLLMAQEGRMLEAARAFAAAAGCGPHEFGSMQACVECVARHVDSGAATPSLPGAPRSPAPLSVAFCSPDAGRLEAARARLGASLEGTGSELLPILAPKSLASAYNDAARRAAHDRLVFVHDDVELVSEAPWAVLSAALDRADVVGLAGSARASGPAVLWSGHPHLHGWVSYPAAEGAGYEVAPFSLRHGLVEGMHTLDGLLIAARRAAVLAVGFDERTFDGFHFYDLDFCVRAHAAGLRLAVTMDVLAVHASRGNFGFSWKAYRDRFVAKHPSLSEAPGRPHWYAARVRSVEGLRAFYAQLAVLGGEAA